MVDYKDFAERMAAAIHKLLLENELTNICWHELNTLRNAYEKEHEVEDVPLPDWAIAYNIHRQLMPNAQLCTKDGRRCGNARVLRLVTKVQCGMTNDYWLVRTDVGTTMHLLAAEVNEMFHIGHYIMKEGM